jgi:hypothetical protein
MKHIFFIFLVFSLFFGFVGQSQAAVSSCTTQDACKVGNVQYTCKGVIGAPGNTDRDDPTTPAFIDHGGLCGGPCVEDTECTAFKSTPFSWSAVQCTGYPPTCIGRSKGAQTCTLKADKSGCDSVAGGTFASCDFLQEAKGSCTELPAGQLAKGPQSGLALLDLVDVATNWVFAIFVVLSIIFVLLAAFQFVTAGGEATKVGEARQKLIWASVGIIIALLAKGLVPVVRSIIGG